MKEEEARRRAIEAKVGELENRLDVLVKVYGRYGELIKLAASKPELRLAVVDTAACLLYDLDHKARADYRRVVKMEGDT